MITVLARLGIAAVFGLLLVACSSSDESSDVPTSVVSYRAAAKATMPMRSLSGNEAAALERLTLEVPTAERARFRKMMAERIANGRSMRIRGNAEMQKLLDAVYEARAKDLRRAAASH